MSSARGSCEPAALTQKRIWIEHLSSHLSFLPGFPVALLRRESRQVTEGSCPVRPINSIMLHITTILCHHTKWKALNISLPLLTIKLLLPWHSSVLLFLLSGPLLFDFWNPFHLSTRHWDGGWDREASVIFEYMNKWMHLLTIYSLFLERLCWAHENSP